MLSAILFMLQAKLKQLAFEMLDTSDSFRNGQIQPTYRSGKQLELFRFGCTATKGRTRSVLSFLCCCRRDALVNFGDQSLVKFDHARSDASINEIIKAKVSMTSSLLYQRSCITHACIGQADEICDASQFRFRIFEKQIVMGNESILFAGRLDQPLVINLPKSQPKGVGSSVSFVHRVGDFQGVAHHDDCFHAREQIFPEWQGQTVTRILPTPEVR